MIPAEIINWQFVLIPSTSKSNFTVGEQFIGMFNRWILLAHLIVLTWFVNKKFTSITLICKHNSNKHIYFCCLSMGGFVFQFSDFEIWLQINPYICTAKIEMMNMNLRSDVNKAVLNSGNWRKKGEFVSSSGCK